MPRNLVALIPARAGSKGIPGKNTRLLGGKPLIAHAIECAIRTRLFAHVLLSTDSADIAAVGRAFGAETPFLRPIELAADDTPMLAVMQHAVREMTAAGIEPEILALLQPTAPFRRDADLVQAVELFRRSPEVDSIVSVEKIPDHFSPHYAMKVEDGYLVAFSPAGAQVTRRQDATPAYSRNGQFYLTRLKTLVESGSIYGRQSLPFITTHKAVNLDTMDDWQEAERLVTEVGIPPRSS